MKTIRIGGVPEHFNYPWYLTLKNKEYQAHNINLRWHDYPGGTGAMNKALRQKDIDIAVVLTEGIIKDIIEGNPCSIVQTFVQSPLIWGVHTHPESAYKNSNDLKGTRAAISRYGSGSHLMAYINAQNHNWDTQKDLKFRVVKNLEGAVESITKKTSNYFMWEKFTTKPLVDKGTFKCLDYFPTPWPCFMIVVRDEVLETYKDLIKIILQIINNTTSEFKSLRRIDTIIASRYQQQLKDVQQWLALTEWSQDVLNENTINHIQDRLLSIGVINEKWDYSKLVTNI